MFQAQTFPQSSPEVFVQPKPNYFKAIILSVLGFLLITSIIYLYWQNQNLQKQILNPPVSPTIQDSTPTPKTVSLISIAPDETAGWKTYNNNVRNYLIKYPSDWKIDTSQAELPIGDVNSAQLIISQGDYKITINWPSAYGPGICIFDDQSRVGAPEMASYCEGKYMELNSIDNKNTYRRLIKPESFNDHNQWEVYTKNKDSFFVTVPPTKYTSPLQYQLGSVEIMDKILSTFKFVDQNTDTSNWKTYPPPIIVGLHYSFRYPPDVQEDENQEFVNLTLGNSVLVHRFAGKVNDLLGLMKNYQVFGTPTISFSNPSIATFKNLNGYSAVTPDGIKKYYFLGNPSLNGFLVFSFDLNDKNSENLFNEIIKTVTIK